MDSDPQKIAEAIKNGDYFEQSRAWYGATYISLISERSYLLVIAALASVAALFSLISMVSLMPLVDRPAIIIPARDSTENFVPRLVRLREQGGDVGHAVEQLLLLQYIDSRESYSSAKFQSNAAHIRAQSSAEVYKEYYAQNVESNPQSVVRRLGEAGTQTVIVRDLNMPMDRKEENKDASTPAPQDIRVATLRFETLSTIGEQVAKSKWTATVKYTYTALGMVTEKNAETGEDETKITDPKFQVISYGVLADAP